ncbi:unnamed protein product [Rotaria magnacalcarata]|uniref:ABC1 atypical kinase-like domain-containing protein n=1 Tax=Rotaria magnacalcarata TaxID=392030 RepID=A0A816KMF1_9BILA|nr:unnamed protein product [Rotaria magnacalcarata]CAF4010235.1 unnamed protein product [Rotaria magnacalcarata]CAF4064576.1 unnamed protein product [Rotaria magnacalcarata]
MNVFRFRAYSLLSTINTCRLIRRNLPSNSNTSTLRAIADRFGVKRRSRRFLRNYILANGLLFGGGSLYYFYYLTPKQRRQIKVTFEGLQRALRSFRIGFLIAVDYKYHFWTIPDTSPEYDSKLKECHTRAAERIAQGCIENGGLYVKMGQGMVSADHILPKEYTDGLRLLQDQALRRQRSEVSQLIDEEFGCEVSDLFSYLSPEPIAAASLAEVYEGRLKSTDERVAVKLQYIDLQDRFAGDMLTIRMILYAIGRIFPKFEFSWMIDSVKSNLERELDFKLEGENADQCYAQLSPHLKYIYVPKVFWKYTTKRVLVMEYIDGIKISDTQKLHEANLPLDEVDTKLVEAMAFQIFHSGFVHADPHPGNVYIRKDPNTTTKSNVQIVLLDHGLYVTIGPKDREALCQLWKAIILKDEAKMKQYSLALGVQAKDYLTFAAVLSMRPIHRPIHDMAILPDIWDRMSPDEQRAARAQGKMRLPSEKELLAMNPQQKLTIRKDFAAIFNDIEDSILRTLYDMPRPLLMILRNISIIRILLNHIYIEKYHRLFAEILIMQSLRSRYGSVSFRQKIAKEEMDRIRLKAREKMDEVNHVFKQLPDKLILVLRNLNQIRSTIRDHGNLIDRHTIMARSAILGARKYETPQRLIKDRIYARLELFMFDLILFKDRMERWFKFKFFKVLVIFGYISKETEELIEQFQ